MIGRSLLIKVNFKIIPLSEIITNFHVTSIYVFNSLTTIGYFWKSLLGYGYLPWSIFPLLLGASTGNLSQSYIDTFFGPPSIDQGSSIASYKSHHPQGCIHPLPPVPPFQLAQKNRLCQLITRGQKLTPKNFIDC